MSTQTVKSMEQQIIERAAQKGHIQEVMLDLIETSTFNSFNGKKVRADLESIRDRWEACLMTRDGDCGITLRDLSSGYYNVDTLYILTNRRNLPALMKFAKTWKADHITKITSDGQFGASIWESKDSESYEFHKLKHEKQTAPSFLGSWVGQEKDNRVVLRLWWD